jgi:hypothetical protein
MRNTFIYGIYFVFSTKSFIIPPLPGRGGGGILFYLCPSKKFFVTFFSATIDGINLIFGHKLHIGMPYHGKLFWTHQIPTSCLPTLLIFIHIEHICSFLSHFSQQILMAEIWYFVTSFIKVPHFVGSVFWPVRFFLSVCRLRWLLYTFNIYPHFSQQLLMTGIWYLVSSFI